MNRKYSLTSVCSMRISRNSKQLMTHLCNDQITMKKTLKKVFEIDRKFSSSNQFLINSIMISTSLKLFKTDQHVSQTDILVSFSAFLIRCFPPNSAKPKIISTTKKNFTQFIFVQLDFSICIIISRDFFILLMACMIGCELLCHATNITFIIFQALR